MKVFGFLVILFIISIIPVAHAQISIGGPAEQKLIEVTVNSVGDVHVKHVINSSNLPKQVNLIEGTISKLAVTNVQGIEKEYGKVGNTNAIIILPSQNDSIIEYDLSDVLLLKDGFWTWDFEYLEKTAFLFPEEIDLIFVDSTPVFLGEKKGIACHGCKMILEYSMDEPRHIKQVNWEDREFSVEIRTFTDIENFDFDWVNKKISFNVKENNRLITTIIPLELLWNPYQVYLDDEGILKHEFNNNGTHVGVSIRPETSGEVSIIGTTVIPEFPIIAPLAIGFLMILALPFIKKFNLH